MKYYNGFFKRVFIGVLVLLFALGTISCQKSNEETSTGSGADVGGSVSTKGMYTSMALLMNGGEGKIWATAKNDLTIFSSTVTVILELYTSDVYQDLYTNMELVERNIIADLNMGETLVVEASTGGVQKYWHGCIKYKVDDKPWKELSSGTLSFSANGVYLGVI